MAPSVGPLTRSIFIRFRGPTAHHDRAKKRALRYKKRPPYRNKPNFDGTLDPSRLAWAVMARRFAAQNVETASWRSRLSWDWLGLEPD